MQETSAKGSSARGYDDYIDLVSPTHAICDNEDCMDHCGLQVPTALYGRLVVLLRRQI